MTQRERQLMTVLLTILAIGGGFYMVFQWIVRPLQTYNKTLASLREEVDTKDLQIQGILNDRRKLERWRLLGLHSNVSKASQEYRKYLNDTLRESGLTVDELLGAAADQKAVQTLGKKTGHTTVAFSVRARGEIKNLARFFQLFQQAQLPHRVRNLTLDRPEGTAAKSAGGQMTVQMVVEALVVHGRNGQTDNWPSSEVLDTLSAILRGPSGFNLMPWAIGVAGPRGQRLRGQPTLARNYADMAKRNPFVGALPPPPPPPPPPPVAKEEAPPMEEGPDMREFVRLVSITHAERDTQTYRNKEAFLRNYLVKTNDIRLCSAPRSGYDSFRLYNEEGSRVVLRGKVLRIDARDVFFQIDDDVYGIHIGQTLAEAMRKSLTNSEIRELGLQPVSLDDAPASNGTGAEKKSKTKQK